jgi:hypothetical protein
LTLEAPQVHAKKRRLGQALLSLLSALLVPVVARADVLNPGELGRFFLGPPAGFAAASGVNVLRNRSVARAWRAPLAVTWSRRLAGGVASNLLVDERGLLFVAGFGRLSQLSPAGDVGFSRAEAFSRALATALLNDGTRVVLSEERQLLGMTPRGVVRFTRAVSGPDDGAKTLLPLWDGGVLVGIGAALAAYGPEGDLRAARRMDEPVRVTLRDGKDVLVVGLRSVYRYSAYAEPSLIARFDNAVLDAVGSGNGSLIALLSNGTLAELSLHDGRVHSLNERTPSQPPTLQRSQAGAWWVSGTAPGRLLLLPFAPAGVPEALATDLPRITAAPAALWLSAPGGAFILASANTPLMHYAADGSREELAAAQCPEPVSLVPAGPDRIALACRSGAMWMIESGPTNAPSLPAGHR